MGCGCGKGKKGRAGPRGARPTGTTRSRSARRPNRLTPTEQRRIDQENQTLRHLSLRRREIERKRRLAIQKALGH